MEIYTIIDILNACGFKIIHNQLEGKMRLKVLLLCLLIAIIVTGCYGHANNQKNEKYVYPDTIEISEELHIKRPDDLADSKYGWFDMTMALYNENEQSYIGYATYKIYDRISPCSTFKIPHALVALDLGIVSQEDSLKEWNGESYQVESWNQNHTLASAIQNSVVWYFKEIAIEVGNDNMQMYLDKLSYGNQDISGELDEFWLKSSLEISVIEQIELLKQLNHNELPFKQEHQEYVKSLIKLEEKDGKTLYGKTGGGDHLGWFVGFVEDESNTTYFAFNILNHEKANGENAKRICIETLKHNGIY